ncbi:MAG: hypothetical protein AMK75_02895 [Planctomycetes bacterium SM23_65]|nr:MAG: hypothetical protein AMK75_02895 [Planctomycetes bacterium SM23_65]
MRRLVKRVILAVALVVLLGVVLVGILVWLVLDPGSPWNRESTMQTVRSWTRLAPLPSSARQLKIETRGSMFTREFIVTFEASSADVSRWLEASPGTSECMPTVQADGWHKYPVTPGGGAQFSEVLVSPDGTKVRIRTYWS